MFYFFVLFFLFTQNCFSQEILISSKNDKKSIPFATIKFLSKENVIGGTYTDENGKALLSLNSEIDKIEISSVGYDILILEKNNITSNIYLIENKDELKEITVIPTKIATKFLGYNIKKRNARYGMSNGLEIVTFIENTFKESKYIKSFSFYLISHSDGKPVIRLVFYNAKNEKPNEYYLKNTYTLDKKKGEIILDLKNLNLQLPKEGLFVGIEYLGFMDKKTNEFVQAEKFTDDNNRKIIRISAIKDKDAPKSYIRNVFRNLGWADRSEPQYYPAGELYIFRTPIFSIEVYE